MDLGYLFAAAAVHSCNEVIVRPKEVMARHVQFARQACDRVLVAFQFAGVENVLHFASLFTEMLGDEDCAMAR